MAMNMEKPGSQQITIRCSCGKYLTALPQHAGKRMRCPGCGQLVIVPTILPRAAVSGVRGEAKGLGKTTLITIWGTVGAFVLACVLFLVWYSHFSHQTKIAAANDGISKAVAIANDWLASNRSDDGETVERQLSEALANEHATEKLDSEAVLNQVRQRRNQFAEQARMEQLQRQATAVFDDAKRQIDRKQVREGITLLQKYILDPHATEKAEAQRLLNEAEIAISDMLTYNTLAGMPEEEFARAKDGRGIDDGKVTHPPLVVVRNETIRKNIDKAYQKREEIRLAEEKRRKAERLAALERKQHEDEIRRKEELDRLARIEAERQKREQESLPQRLDIDPALQGLWKLHATSNDKGKTIEKHDGVVFARVSGTKIRTIAGEGATLTVDKVFIVKDDDGNPANLVKFTNGTVWMITKEPKQTLILVGVMEFVDGKLREKVRFLVTSED